MRVWACFFWFFVVLNVATGVVAPDQPQQSNLVFWLDAADTSTINTSTGSSVSAWADKSPNAFDVTATTSSNEPTYNASDRSIDFAGTDKYLRVYDAPIQGTEARTVFLVLDADVTAADRQSALSLAPNVASGEGYNFFIEDPNDANRGVGWRVSGNKVMNYLPVKTNTEFNAEDSVFSTTLGANQNIQDNKYYLDGVELTEVGQQQSATINTADDGVLIGAYSGSQDLSVSSQYDYKGRIHEILVYNAELTEQQRQEVEGYLAAKWGRSDDLPENHPYFGATTLLIQETAYLRPSMNESEELIYRVGDEITLETSFPSNTTLSGYVAGPTQTANVSVTSNGSPSSFTYNASETGWHTVKLGSDTYRDAFYVANTWNSSYEDNNGERYTFNTALNITDLTGEPRRHNVVEAPLNFTFTPKQSSIHVLKNTTRGLLEVPSQQRDAELQNGEVTATTLIFPYTLEGNQTSQYVVAYRKTRSNTSYENMTTAQNGDTTTITAGSTNFSFNASVGGLLSSSTKYSAESLVEDTQPLQFYPELDEGIATTYTARSDSTSTVEVTPGPVETQIQTKGFLNDLSDYPYTQSCTARRNEEVICEFNLTFLSDTDTQNFYVDGYTADNAFTEVTVYDGAKNTESLDESGTTTYTNTSWVAFLSNETRKGFAAITTNTSSPVTQNPRFEVIDASQVVLRQRLIDTNTAVPSETTYTRTTTFTGFNAYNNYSEVEATYREHTNPVTVSIGEEQSNDATPPSINNVSLLVTDDQTNGSITFTATDDTFLDDATVTVTGPTPNGTHTVYEENLSLRENGSLTNQTTKTASIPGTALNTGNITVSIDVRDLVRRNTTLNTTATVTDTTAPNTVVTTTPNSSAELDPNKTINITATLTEYTNISSINGATNQGNLSFTLTNTSGNTYTYTANTTPATEQTLNITVTTTDTENNTASTTTTRNVYYDTTWNAAANLTNITDTFQETLRAGNITLQNTGDTAVTIDVSAGLLNDRVTLNGTELPMTVNLNQDQNKTYAVNATTRNAPQGEGVDVATISFEAANHTETTQFDITTTTGGPFLYIEIEAPNTVNPDETFNVTIDITNRGNESAAEFEADIQTILSTTDAETTSRLSLPVGFTETIQAKYVADTPGTYTVLVNATSTNESNTATTSIQALQPDTQEAPSSGGSGGSSGGGGGFGAPSDTTEETDLAITGTENITVITGESTSFTTSFTNPYNEGLLRDVEISIDGFLTQFLSVEPSTARFLTPNKTQNLTFNLSAPTYLEEDTYEVTLRITGTNNASTTKTEDNITITNTEISELNISRSLFITVYRAEPKKAENTINTSRTSLSNADVPTRELQRILEDMENAYAAGQMGVVVETETQFRRTLQTAQDIRSGIEVLQRNIERSTERGIEVRNTERLLELATASYERSDFEEATNRLNEAESTYALETSGVIPWKWWIKNHVPELIAGVLAAMLLAVISFRGTKYVYYTEKEKEAKEQQNVLLGLMQEVQKECFEDKTLGMDEYLEAMQHYEERLANAVTDRITFATKKTRMRIPFSSEKQRLEQERDRVKEELRKTQKNYLEEGQLEARIYNQTMKQFRDRLSEIEERLAELIVESQV